MGLGEEATTALWRLPTFLMLLGVMSRWVGQLSGQQAAVKGQPQNNIPIYRFALLARGASAKR